MKLLLTCWTYENQLSHDYFFNMPPGFYSHDCATGFVPDYPLLMLFDHFVGSSKTFDLVHENKYYEEVASLWDALKSDDRLELCDFDAMLEPYEEKIASAVKYDLGNITSWFPEFRECAQSWRNFRAVVAKSLQTKSRSVPLSAEERGLLASMLQKSPDPDFMIPKDTEWNVDQLFGSWRKRIAPEVRKDALYIFERYLRYVSSNIILGGIVGATIHDWSDVAPLYRKKFDVGLHLDKSAEQATQVRKLFRVVFPEFQPTSVRNFVKILHDPRVDSLRQLVTRAVAGDVEFDERFANDTIRSVLKAERRLALQRDVVGWLAMPTGLIPWVGDVIEKGIEEGVGLYLRRRAEKQAPWFYMVSSISRE